MKKCELLTKTHVRLCKARASGRGTVPEPDLAERHAVGLVQPQGLADAREGVRALAENHRLVVTDLELHNNAVQELKLARVRDPGVLDGIFVLDVLRLDELGVRADLVQHPDLVREACAVPDAREALKPRLAQYLVPSFFRPLEGLSEEEEK